MAAKTAEKEAFLNWWFSTDRQGTQGDWAVTHDVAQPTLSEWKKSPEFIERLNGYRILFKPDFVEATMTMLKKAKQGNVNAYRAVAEVLGEKAAEKLSVSVDRVAYADPVALVRSEQPQTPQTPRAN